MGEIARWNGHKFEVSSNLIRGFSGLTIKGSSETEDKTSSNQKYVSRKNGKPREMSFDVNLLAQLGCDVRTEALKFVEEATAGAKDYCYVGNKKLVPCSLMLTEATVTVPDNGIINSGKWTQAQVKCTFKQCSKNDSTSTSSGGSGKSSTKTTSTTTQKKAEEIAKNVVNTVKTVATTLFTNLFTGKSSTKTQTQKDTEKAVNRIGILTSNAAKATATKKGTSKTAGGGGGKTVVMVK